MGLAVVSALSVFGSALNAAAEPVARFGDAPVSSPARPPAPKPSGGDAGPARNPVRASALVLELYRRGRERERRGDPAQAAAAYVDAIGADPTYGPALLALARLRQVMGDVEEAEALCARAARLPAYAADALTLRAALRKARGLAREAREDLAQAASLDPSPARLEALADAYVAAELWPAALAVWRQLLAAREAGTEPERVAAARIKVRALGALAGETDPVAAGRASSRWERRALARIAARTARGR